ncbi:MAG TPA: hypothetical protein ENK46_12210 [Flavobacteriia bacterium]|nr:hypothetical protein [Flavobacteriia bacterium]
MKKIKIVLLSLTISSFVACSSNDDTEDMVKECVTCDAYNPLEGPTVPEREICKGANGNAFIQGTDTTIEYNEYIEIQRRVTTCQ